MHMVIKERGRERGGEREGGERERQTDSLANDEKS